jgi:hypothetical protein
MNIWNFSEKSGSFVIATVRRFQCSLYNPVKHQGEVVFCLKVVVGRRIAHQVEPVISMIGTAERPSPSRRIRAFLGETASGTQNASLLRKVDWRMLTTSSSMSACVVRP